MTIETVSAVAAVAKPEAVNAEPSMAEYAAKREAEMRGDTHEPQVEEAAAEAVVDPAAATESEEESAVATDDNEDSGRTTTESATEEDADVQIEDDHPKKKGIQKRFSEMTAKQKATQDLADQHKREADEARAQLAEMKAAAEKAAAERAEAVIPVVPKIEDDPVPNRDAFDDPDEYVAALSAHTTRSEIRKANEAAHQAVQAKQEEARKAQEEANHARVQEQIIALHKNFNDRVEKAAADYPDYVEKVTNNENLTLRNDVFFAIEKAEMAPHILYHLASNPDEAKNLNAMDQFDAAVRLGELQAEIRIARKPKPSKAAEPIKPVGNRASPERKTPHEESMEEYASRREKEMKTQAAQKYRANR